MSKTFIQSKSFGVVVYMDEQMYSDDKEQNMFIHFPITRDVVINNLILCLYNLKLSEEIINCIVIGHEHGEEKGKCHMQIYIEFDKKVRKILQPGSFSINNVKYLYIFQHAKSPKKLQEYCKKGNDFSEFLPCKKIKEILRENNMISELEDVDDPYDILLNKNDLSNEQIKNLFQKCNISEYKKTYLVYAKKIYDTYSNFIRKTEDTIDFKWNFPKHMLDVLSQEIDLSNRIFMTYKKLFEWYKEYCIIDQNVIKRRKALFLFSLRGGLGKSFFARSLVPEINICNSPFYVYCRGSLDAGEFLKKENTARIVILDDINYIDKDIEIWKALAVSEPTNIRSPYHNIPWMKSLPCVLLSNNIKTLKYWMETDDLKNRCVFVSVDFYIGPPGTEILSNQYVDYILSDDVEIKIRELNRKI